MDDVTIGAKEIYEAAMGLRADVFRVTSDMSAVRQAIVDLDRRIEQRFADHESRLRALEASRWPLRSITVVFGLVAVVISAIALWGGK